MLKERFLIFIIGFMLLYLIWKADLTQQFNHSQMTRKPSLSSLEVNPVPTWFAIKLNADPTVYLNRIHDLFSLIPHQSLLKCLDQIHEGDLIHIIYVQSQCYAERNRLSGRTRQALDLPIFINHDSLDDLISLPKIGRKTALNIIEGRPWQSIDELSRIRGISMKKVRSLKPLISLHLPKVLWSRESNQ